MNPANLVLMDTGIFCEGMRIKARIYYLYNGSYVLLCKNVILSKSIMKKLQNAAKTTNGVFIEEGDYEGIWNESLRQYSIDADTYESECQKTAKQYQLILSETVHFLGEILPSKEIPLQMADSITNSIAEGLNHLDPSSILHCVHMIHQADSYLYTHSVNVATLNGMLGKWLALPDSKIRMLVKVGLLHDLGKLKIPARILYKPSCLTDDEFKEIKKHPSFSYEMLRKSGEKDHEILMAVLQHHEKVNGTGYPYGLTGQDISLAARITAISDIYDAMVSKRCYKDACTPFEVLAQFKENRFSDLDLQLVNTFLDNITYLLVGMRVKLSNGEEGEVIFVRPHDFAHPVVKVENRIFTTNAKCQCVSAEGMSL